MSAKQLSESKCHGGFYRKYEHKSSSTNCVMKFSVFVPPQAVDSKRVPVLYFLSGLTCNEENFVFKAGAFVHAAKHGICIVAPDTSPRGCNIPTEEDSWDFGTGSGFYVDATQEPWSNHYNMYSYVTQELPSLVESLLPVTSVKSVFGHSMGGHGAVMVALKASPGSFKSVSAFAPLLKSSSVAIGAKNYTAYLGADETEWKAWDCTELVKGYEGDLKILIDQGTEDGFYKKGGLGIEGFVEACPSGVSVQLRMQAGYDHGYWFIQSFIKDHMDYHASALLE